MAASGAFEGPEWFDLQTPIHVERPADTAKHQLVVEVGCSRATPTEPVAFALLREGL